MSSRAAALYPWRTRSKTTSRCRWNHGYSADEKKKRIEQTLDLVNLTGFRQEYPWQLSGGMQQRASIARALAFDADLLLMDEPFARSTKSSATHLNSELLKLWDRTNKTICFVNPLDPEAVTSRPRSSS